MKKIMSMILVIVLLLGLFPMQAFASNAPMPDPMARVQRKPGLAEIAPSGYQKLRVSQKLLDVLKIMEGYSQKAFWDHQQYSIGYGTRANHQNEILPNGEAGYAEAERRLIDDIKSREELVNNYCRNSLRKQPNQNQFDALVSLVYNLGTGWFFNSRMANWLRNPTTEIEFVDAMGQWCSASGEVLFGLMQRRIREAIIFLKGEYYLPARPSREHLIKTEEFKQNPTRYVKPNGSLPYYAGIYLKYDSPTEYISGERARYKQLGDVIGPLSTPHSSDYTFDGWAIVAENNHDISPRPASSSTVVNNNLELAAQWVPISHKPSKPNPSKPEAAFPFIDVSAGAWYRDKVEFVYANKYMAGTSETTFSPNWTMTRAMLVMVLYRIAGSPSVTDAQRGYFVDTQDQYYTDAVAWAKANGIVDGIGERRFGPDYHVTRQDAELIFYKMCVDYLKVSNKKTADLSKFDDADKVADYAKEAVQWAVATKMMAGDSRNGGLYLEPKGNLTRAQGATLITRCVTDIIN